MTITTVTLLGAIGLCWVLGVIVHLIGTWVALWPSKKAFFQSKEVFLEPISIIKPLKGCDSELSENLTTFLDLDYPSYEILFSVATVEDPAFQIVSSLIKKNPGIAAKLIVSPVNIGPNPKVNNMVMAYERAKNDLILISDSNVRVEKDYLKKLSRYMRDRNVGMVTAVISGTQDKGIGGKLEAVFLNSFYSRWMKLLFFVGRPCVVGKSMLFRKSMAQRFGGMNVLSRYLAEDYMAGEAVRRLGLKVVLSDQPIQQTIGKLGLREFWSRHIRWGRIRKSQALLAFLIEPILGSVISSICGTLFLSALYDLNSVNLFFMQMIIWFFLEIPVLVQSGSRISLSVGVFWFLREVLAFPLWIHIALGNTVQWRGKELKLEGGGLLTNPAI